MPSAEIYSNSQRPDKLINNAFTDMKELLFALNPNFIKTLYKLTPTTTVRAKWPSYRKPSTVQALEQLWAQLAALF